MVWSAKKIHKLPKQLLEDTQIVTERTSTLTALSRCRQFIWEGQGIIEPPMNLPDTPVLSIARFPFHPSLFQKCAKPWNKLIENKIPWPWWYRPQFPTPSCRHHCSPLTCIFNLILDVKEIPKLWKSAFVLPLLKGGDPSLLDNYRPM
jgi:hypothetical protein